MKANQLQEARTSEVPLVLATHSISHPRHLPMAAALWTGTAPWSLRACQAFLPRRLANCGAPYLASSASRAIGRHPPRYLPEDFLDRGGNTAAMASATAGPQPASAGPAAEQEAPDRSFPREPRVGIGAVVLRWAPHPATGKEVNTACCLNLSKPHASAP